MATAALLTLLASCASEPTATEEHDFGEPLAPGKLALVRAGEGETPDFREGWIFRRSFEEALGESLEYFAKPSSREYYPVEVEGRTITHSDQVATLDALRRILRASADADEFNAWCRVAFDVYRSVGRAGTGDVLFTAYCEPIYEGRLKPDERFRYPLHGLPPDLVKDREGRCLGRRTASGLVPWPERGELVRGDLLDGLELVWLSDPFEVYIAQVQGSARVNLADGTQMCVGYAGKTEHPYRSIGRLLVEEGRIEADDLNLSTLKRYFAENPGEIDRVLPQNPSFVFFVEREPGPFGSLGAKVVPYHAFATDKEIFPRGGFVVARTRLPRLSERGPRIFEERVLLGFDHDTGGAIRSPARADIFIGTGAQAEVLAGYTQEVGRLYYLFLKPGAPLPPDA